MQYSDEKLIKQILAGETNLYELLIRRYNPYLYRIGRSQNYSHDDTQDLMQDTYVDAYTNLSGFEGRSAFKTWIVRIMLNNCYRKRQKWGFKHIISTLINENSFPDLFNRQRTDPNKIIMNEELNAVIENALLRIPMNYRMVFTFRELNGLSIKETADTLKISEANVKVRLNRAKAMLRKEVEKSYSAEEIFEFNLIYCDAMVARVMKKIMELVL